MPTVPDPFTDIPPSGATSSGARPPPIQPSNQPTAAPDPPLSPSEDRARQHMRRQHLNPDVHEVYRGATLGWGDDIDVMAEETGTALTNLGNTLTGRPSPYSASEAGRQAHAEIKRVEKEFERHHPRRAGFEQFGGALLTPGTGEANAALKAAKVPGLVRGAVIGAGMGGIAGAGFGEGDWLHRAEEGVVGGVVGAPLGVAGEVAGWLAPHVVKGMISAGQEAIDHIRMWGGHDAPNLTPEQRAKALERGRAVVKALIQKHDPTGEKLRFSPVEARGKPITAAEALGSEARTQLKIAGRRSGQTADRLELQLTQRAEEAGQRITNDFGEIAGVAPDAVDGQFIGEMARLRAKAAPLYERAYAHLSVDSNLLRSLLGRPSMQDALKAALRLAKEEGRKPGEVGIEEVRQPIVNPRTGKPYLGKDGQPLTQATGETYEVLKPSMQTWDYIKRGLDDVIGSHRKNGVLEVNNEVRSMLDTLDELRGALTDPHKPWGNDYAAALNAGGEPLRMEEAFKAAKSLMSGTMTERDFLNRVARFTGAQMDALKAGIVAQVRNDAMAGFKKLGQYATPLMRAKMERIFGKEAAEELGARIQDERALAQHGARMKPGVGSDTSETLLGSAEQDSAIKSWGIVARHFRDGKYAEGIGHVVSLVGLMPYRGAQQPFDEATRDVIGALLSQKPSELVETLEKAGETPELASKVTKILENMGLFAKPAQKALIQAMARGSGFVVQEGEKKPAAAKADPPPAGTLDPKNDPFAGIQSGGPSGGSVMDTTPTPTTPDQPASPDTTGKGASTSTVSTNDPAFVKHASELTGISDPGDMQLFLDVGGIESAVGKGKLNPAAYNPANPGGVGHGASGSYQWRGTRQLGEGVTVDDQLKHVGHELKGKYSEVIPLLKAATTREDKYDVILTKYEGLKRGGPDYVTDLEALLGKDGAAQYMASKGITPQRRRETGPLTPGGDTWARGSIAPSAPSSDDEFPAAVM